MNRRVGVEIEFLDIDMARASALLEGVLNTPVRRISDHEHVFKTAQGEYRLEVDFELLKKLGRDDAAESESSVLREIVIGSLDLAARVATPLELVTPPLPRDALVALDELLASLADAGARGTGESIVYAFGVHFNPEADTDHEQILKHLRAFMCMQDWLSDRDATDITRKLTAFALPFPDDYERLVLDRHYAPSRDDFIDDYLDHNPTRNRALDLLPLFAHLDAPRVQAVVSDDRVNARPTYHYRLPNSRIGEDDWSVLQPWRDWLTLESLADDSERLARLCALRLAFLAGPLPELARHTWIEQCDATLADQ